MNFYDVLAAEKWGGGIPTINFFDLLFAQSLGGGEQWETYEGTLPATLNANGDDMRQYQVYGNIGGVGDRTRNLCIGKLASTNMNASGQIIYNSEFSMQFAQVTQGETYSYKNSSTSIYGFFEAMPLEGSTSYDNQRIVVSDTNVSFTAPITGYVAFRTSLDTQGMLTEGSTAPASFVPFGYEVDISTSDGTNTTTTPIYIGDDPLEKDEYADYTEQKVYRRTVNQFNKDTALDGYEIVNNGYNRNENWCVSDFIPVESDTLYKSQNSGGAVLSFTDKSSQPTRLGGALNTNGVRTLSETKFIKINCQISQKASCVVAKSDDLPETYIPYLQSADPPVPLPALPTAEGETVIDYAGESVAPEKVVLEYKKGGN